MTAVLKYIIPQCCPVLSKTFSLRSVTWACPSQKHTRRSAKAPRDGRVSPSMSFLKLCLRDQQGAEKAAA